MARRILFVVVSLLFLTVVLRAQDVASITGVITDQTGAVVPGVKVTLENAETGATYTTVANEVGSYTLNEVKPGPGYKIEFSHAGFKDVVVSGLYMNVDATRTQNATLTLGSAEQTVEVSAASQNVTLDTTDATVGNSFQVQFLNDLPIADRDSPAALFVQQPGVTLDGAVTGARVDQNNVTVDGLDVNDNATGNFGAIVGNAPVDSVQEFRGVTAGPLSSAGEGGGGQFELVTRSGTNQFHGAAVEYHRDTDTEANDWFNNNAGIGRPPLIRNQFGGNIGGPILKNKLFFFFDYNGRRDTLSNLVERTVPLPSFASGNVSYVNASGSISTLGPSQLAALDPQKIGFNAALLALFKQRYPAANDLSGAYGDLVNTAGFRFNAPFPYKEDDYVQRIDYDLNSKMKVFGRGTFTRTNGTQQAIQFPGDPETFPFLDQSYAWVVGHTWTISDNKVNQAEYGETFENYAFPNVYNPTGATQYQTIGGNGTGGAILSAAYGSAINAQARTYPIPVVKDDFSWEEGKHSITFGGTFKWESPNGTTILDYNSPTIGLGGFTPNLNPSLEPKDIGSGNAIPLWDSAYALALAPYTAVASTFNYNAQGGVLPAATGSRGDYRYYETELYVGDTWKVTPALALSYGLRWQNYSVPYDVHGLESIENFDFDTYFGDRVAQSASGTYGNTVIPFIQYTLGGKANHAPGYYQPNNRNFAPRFAFAYSPFTNQKSVVSGGIGVIYDHTVINAVQYQQSQYSYLFQASATEPFGVEGDPVTSLTTDQRFSGVNNPPSPPTPPQIVTPFVPYVSGTGANAVPTGLANGQAFNEIIDPKLKTPYSIQFDFGVQHEFPQGYLLRATYVGRLGRRLLAQADANQLIEFPDLVSGQLMSAAFANISQQVRSGVNPLNVTTQPWYENVLTPGAGVAYGYPSNTALVASALSTYVGRGDFADTMEALSSFGLLPPNVGMAAQFSENTFYTNKGASAYDGLLVTLHKNAGYGLQFDFNYTFSHSIDNVSLIANQAAIGGYGFICDVLRPLECRSNSDFDVTHYFNGNFIYDLPVGRGKTFVSSAPFWLNEAIGGWKVSGLPNYHTGNAYFAEANAFVAGYANDAPAILTGPISDLKTHVNGGEGQPLFAVRNPTKANEDYTGPIGFAIGSRNNLRGPGYFDLDLGLGKTFPIYSDRVNLIFRADAFNALNHPNFSTPSTDITDSSVQFGVIQSTVAAPFSSDTARVLQGALRLEF
jgi:hypothetical protein